MRRQRISTLYSSVNHHSKPHCPEDASCFPCCKCVERLRKQNKILIDKHTGAVRDKDQYLKEIIRLNKEVKVWEKRQREFQDFDQVKRRLREEVKTEMENQRRVDDMIVKEKLASGKKQKETLQKEKAEVLESLQEFSKKVEKMTKECRSLEENYNNLQKDFQSKTQESNKNEEIMACQKKRNSELEAALKDKTEVIIKLEKGLSTSEHNYLIQKAKSTENDLQLLKSKQQIQSANNSISTLKKDTEEKKTEIKELSAQKDELGKLVHNLDSTLNSYTVLQGSLRTRILASQEYAIQKQIQVKHLQSDFYEALYRKSI